MQKEQEVVKPVWVELPNPLKGPESKLTTTFNKLREAGACERGYRTLAKHLGGVDAYGEDTPISLLTILGSNGVDDCLWSLRAAVEPECEYLARMIAADCAESVLHLFTVVRPGDNRPKLAIDAARAFARGEIGAAAGAAAWDAAWAAAWAAARDAAWDAAGGAAQGKERDKQAAITRAWLTGEVTSEEN